MYKAIIFMLLGVGLLADGALCFSQSTVDEEIHERLHNADSLRRRIKYSDAWTQLAMVSSLQDQMNTEQHAWYYKLCGVTQLGLNKYEEALENYAKSKAKLETLTTPKSKVDLVNIYTLRGTIYNKTGDYEKAKDLFLEGISESEKLPEEDKIKTVRYLYNNLAETYELLGQFDDAVKTNYLALDILKAQGNEMSVGAGVAYNNLGISYRKLGRNKLAQENYYKAAEIFTAALGPNSRYTYAALGNAATAINEYGDAEKAIPILNKRLEIFQEDSAADLAYLVRAHASLGYVYKQIGDSEKSTSSYERALGMLRTMDTYKRDLEIRILRQLATIEISNESYDKARRYLDEAFKIQDASNNLSPEELARLYRVNSNYFQNTGDLEASLSEIKKANRISSGDEKNQLWIILNIRPRYIDALIRLDKLTGAQLQIDSTALFVESKKARIPTSELVLIKANLDGLKAKIACATGTAQQAILEGLDKKLIEHTKLFIEATASTPGKKNQRATCTTCFNVGNLLEALANLHLQAYQQSADVQNKHLEKALAALDLKQEYLSNIWKNEHFSGLPKAQQDEAKEIRQRIAAYDLLIFENDSNSPAAQKQNALYLDSILRLRPKLRTYISQIASKPLEFDKNFDLQQLDSDQGILLVHEEGDQLHLLFVHQEGILHHKIKDAARIRLKLKAYSTFCKSENLGFSESLETLNLSASLYKTLIGWIPSENTEATKRLAIIESSTIENLPFAALLTQPVPAGALGFRDLAFAVEKHAFSYHQSPSAFFEAQQKSRYENTIDLTALAPSQLSNAPLVSTNRDALPNVGLEYAAGEAQAIINKFKGTILTAKEATYEGLLSAFKKSNVIHIASHASSNFTDGEYSYIIVTDTSLLSGERLYARTLTEHELPADLVVLGACESGSGQIGSGEGTLSLSSVFLNAGTQAVLHTGWRVEDKRSQSVLLGFYDQLEREQALDQALVEAQRSYLSSTGGQYLHPFYWSAFEVSGNLTPIGGNWSVLLFIGAGAVLFLFVFFFLKQR